MYKINFNGVDIPSFVRIKSVSMSLLPENLGNGGAKLFNVTVFLIKDKNKSIGQMSREFAIWLKGDNFRLSPLVFSDDSDITYMASVGTAPTLEDLIFYGSCDIQFVVPDGLGIGEMQFKKCTTPNATLEIPYNGLMPSYPIIKYTPNFTNSANVKITITDEVTGKRILLNGAMNEGETITIDCGKKVVKRGNVVDMLLIDYSSDWIKLEESHHRLKVNQSGECSVTYVENY